MAWATPSSTLRTNPLRLRCRRYHRAPAIGLWPGLILLAGCAIQQPSVPKPAPLPPRGEIQLLVNRDRILTSLQTAAVMEYAGPSGHLKARERISIQRPANLRVEALSPLGVALIVTADSNAIAVFDPGKNTITRGPADAATLDRVARIPLEPAQAARLLLALAPDAAILSGTPASSATDANGVMTLSYAVAAGATTQLAFSGRNLCMVRSSVADRSVSYEVHYSDYRDIGGIEFPHTIEASFPATSTTIKFRFDQPLIDQTIPASTFVLNPGPRTTELQLGFVTIPDAAHG